MPGTQMHAAAEAEVRLVWIIRPDCHIAAILDEPRAEEILAAARRAIGFD